MAKKKSVSSSQPATKTETPVAAVAGTPTRTLTHAEIGLVAGQVWQLLADQGEQSLASVKSTLDAPPELVLAAIGWLAREDKLMFKTSGRAFKVSLR
ncbi:MAG: winged helix-turn-helix domain-containing protein [Planctomycetota bacterium]|nr:winged helix-turn-helix domain-containing protein [Planctomycetota bacterium]